MLKIAIKGLIETSMRMGRTLNDNHSQLQQFLILMELVFKHRLKCTLIQTVFTCQIKFIQCIGHACVMLELTHLKLITLSLASNLIVLHTSPSFFVCGRDWHMRLASDR